MSAMKDLFINDMESVEKVMLNTIKEYGVDTEILIACRDNKNVDALIYNYDIDVEMYNNALDELAGQSHTSSYTEAEFVDYACDILTEIKKDRYFRNKVRDFILDALLDMDL